jgi:hypothetical protein
MAHVLVAPTLIAYFVFHSSLISQVTVRSATLQIQVLLALLSSHVLMTTTITMVYALDVL